MLRRGQPPPVPLLPQQGYFAGYPPRAAELADVLADEAPRTPGLSIFVPLGIALEDVAVAAEVEQARRRTRASASRPPAYRQGQFTTSPESVRSSSYAETRSHAFRAAQMAVGVSLPGDRSSPRRGARERSGDAVSLLRGRSRARDSDSRSSRGPGRRAGDPRTQIAISPSTQSGLRAPDGFVALAALPGADANASATALFEASARESMSGKSDQISQAALAPNVFSEIPDRVVALVDDSAYWFCTGVDLDTALLGLPLEPRANCRCRV